MTACAASSVATASSTVPWLYWGFRPSAAEAPGVPSAVANAPKRTFAKDRFMALLIIIDRMNPLVPSRAPAMMSTLFPMAKPVALDASRSEEHTSELQSRLHLVCRLLLEK